MWLDKKVSVILPTYNEKDSIRSVIERFFATGVVDEVVVVNNNAAPGTSEEVAGTGAREVFEARQGYGWGCRRGLAEATGDLLVLCEPDDTFDPQDVRKLLVYAEDFPYVMGTRTTKEFIWNGANMGRFLRWGNWAVAKQVEVLFNSSMLTDVGCTYRVLHRESYLRVREAFAVGDSHFGPHLTLLLILAGVPLTEVSVNYRPRIGESMVTGSFVKAFKLGCKMISMISEVRIKSWIGAFDDAGVIPYPEPIPPAQAEAFLV